MTGGHKLVGDFSLTDYGFGPIIKFHLTDSPKFADVTRATNPCRNPSGLHVQTMRSRRMLEPVFL
jgi:hypothetical protein